MMSITTLLLFLLGLNHVESFVPSSILIKASSSGFVIGDQIQHVANPNSIAPLKPIRSKGSSALKCALLPTIVTKISPPVRNAILLGTAAAVVYKNRRVFYPGSAPDPSFSEPLPEGR